MELDNIMPEVKKDSLFISYNWNDGNVYADELENQLCDYFDVKRDKSQLKYNDDMYDFMAEIANCDYVVVILTAAYVKSVNCMMEASYLVQQPDWGDSAMVLVIDESIYGTDRKLEILEYWDEKLKKADTNNIDLGKTIVEEDRKNLVEINKNVETFLFGISRKRNPTQIAIVNEFVRKKRNNLINKVNDKIAADEQTVKDYIKENGITPLIALSDNLGFSPAYTSRLLKSLIQKKAIEVADDMRSKLFSPED